MEAKWKVSPVQDMVQTVQLNSIPLPPFSSEIRQFILIGDFINPNEYVTPMLGYFTALPGTQVQIRVSVVQIVPSPSAETLLQTSTVAKSTVSLVRCIRSKLRQALLKVCFADCQISFYTVQDRYAFYGRALTDHHSDVYTFQLVRLVEGKRHSEPSDTDRFLLPTALTETLPKTDQYVVIKNTSSGESYTLESLGDGSFLLQAYVDDQEIEPETEEEPGELIEEPAPIKEIIFEEPKDPVILPSQIQHKPTVDDRRNLWLPDDSSQSVLFNPVHSNELRRLRDAFEGFFSNDESVQSQLNTIVTLVKQLKRYAQERNNYFFKGINDPSQISTLYDLLFQDLLAASDRMHQVSSAQLTLYHIIHSILPNSTIGDAKIKRRPYAPYLNQVPGALWTEQDWLGLKPFDDKRVLVGRTKDFRPLGWQSPFADDLKIWENQVGVGGKRKRDVRPKFGGAIDMVEF
jgi:hypothetical protein